MATNDGERQQVLATRLREQVAKVLGTAASKINMEQPLIDLGLDSLVAVELRYWIENELKVDMPIMALLQTSSIARLAGQTLETHDQLRPIGS